jgi:predicted nucleotidyltransferase
MDYTIQKKTHSKTHLYPQQTIDLAYEFSKRAYKELSSIIKGIVLFGSVAKGQTKPTSDIDILCILDDVQIDLTPEVLESYKIITQKIVSAVSPSIHITTLKYTTFFDYARTCDPIGMNILREGIALVDTGFFDPLQELLFAGRIRPTYESIWMYQQKSSQTLFNSRWHLLRACEDLYWAVTDSAHAAIMQTGVIPPSPAQLSHTFHIQLVVPKYFDKKHENTITFFYELYKQITSRKLKDVSGAQYESYYHKAREFVLAVEAYLERKAHKPF